MALSGPTQWAAVISAYDPELTPTALAQSSGCEIAGLPADRPSRRKHGRVLLDKVLPLQLGPKLRRNRRLDRAHIGKDLRLGMRAEDQRRGDVRRRRELKRSGSQIGTELRRHS